MLSVRQAAERMNCSPGTIYALVESKLLDHTRVGRGRGKILISESDIEAYLKARAVAPIAPPPESARPTAARAFKHIRV